MAAELELKPQALQGDAHDGTLSSPSTSVVSPSPNAEPPSGSSDALTPLSGACRESVSAVSSFDAEARSRRTSVASTDTARSSPNNSGDRLPASYSVPTTSALAHAHTPRGGPAVDVIATYMNTTDRRTVKTELMRAHAHLSSFRGPPASRARAACRKLQRRWHGGHGHSHGFGALDEEEDEEAAALRKKLSAEDVRAADRITWIGVWMNVVLSAAKGVAGVAFHSSGLLADAVHSASDLASDAVTLVTLKYCARPPDARQPYGYGKYESIGALAVSLLLVGGSAGIVVHSFETLLALMQASAAAAESLAQLELSTGEVAATSLAGGPESIHPAALAIAAVSVGAKEWLYRSTSAIGKRVNSSVLIANAWHHRSDAVTSIVAMAGIGLSLAGLPLFDPIAGMLVGGIILKMGGEIGLTSVRELCDAQLPASVVTALEEAAHGVVLESEGEIREIRQLRSRRIGRHVHVDLTLVVDEGVGMRRACQWKDRAKRSIKAAVPRVKDIIVELATPSQSPSTVFEQQRDDDEDAAMALDHSLGHSHGHDEHHHHHEDMHESNEHQDHEHNNSER